jgi:hypothetical protein
MLHHLSKALAAAVLIPLALGCKREPVPSPTSGGLAPATTGTAIGQKVQQWLKSQPLGISAQGQRSSGNNLPKHTMLWWQTRQHQGQYITPLTLEGNAAPAVRAALTATEDAQGQISGGQYVVVLPDSKQMDQAAAQQDWIGQLAGPSAVPEAFSGAVLYYNTAGALMANKVYKNGQPLPNAKALLTAKRQTATASKNATPGTAGYRPPSPCATQLVCIDWYWQTFVDGVLVSEVYLYTTCECPGDGGGGGGPNGETEALPDITSCERTKEQALSILAGISLDQINDVTMTSGIQTAPGADSIIRVPRQPRWGFLKLRLYLDYVLRYSMIFDGVAYKNGNADPYWKWEYLNVGQLHRTGTMAPCMDVSFTYSVVAPIISADKRTAVTGITYTAIATVPCLFGAESGTYPGSHPYCEFDAGRSVYLPDRGRS